MNDSGKTVLDEQLSQAIRQLQQAQAALHNNQFTHASIYVGNVQNQLPQMRQKLTHLN